MIQGVAVARLVSTLLAVFAFACVFVAFQRPAFGYADPGTAFVALQSAASVMAACAFYMRRRIRAFFSKDKGAEIPAPQAKIGRDSQESV